MRACVLSLPSWLLMPGRSLMFFCCCTGMNFEARTVPVGSLSRTCLYTFKHENQRVSQ
jgi:hypothetical protein